MTDRIYNASNQIIGGTKEAIGSALGFPEIAASGAAQRAQAENAQRTADAENAQRLADVKNTQHMGDGQTRAENTQRKAEDQTRAEGVGHKVEGEVQQKIGALTGDKSMEARGRTNETIGNIQQNV